MYRESEAEWREVYDFWKEIIGDLERVEGGLDNPGKEIDQAQAELRREGKSQ